MSTLSRATAPALFGLPVEGLHRKLFDTGRPVADVDEHLAQQHVDVGEDDAWPADVPDNAFPSRLGRPASASPFTTRDASPSSP